MLRSRLERSATSQQRGFSERLTLTPASSSAPVLARVPAPMGRVVGQVGVMG